VPFIVIEGGGVVWAKAKVENKRKKNKDVSDLIEGLDEMTKQNTACCAQRKAF
jgi:hypothetical protein